LAGQHNIAAFQLSVSGFSYSNFYLRIDGLGKLFTIHRLPPEETMMGWRGGDSPEHFFGSRLQLLQTENSQLPWRTK
jgi:hypothetical protein